MSQSQTPDDAASRSGAALLDRLISEELLLQRGIELGMPQSDNAVRTAIIGSLVASITAEADAANPSDPALQQHLTDYANRFSHTVSLAINAWQTNDEKLAQLFAESIRNDSGQQIAGDIKSLPNLPETMASIEALRDVLGPGITAAAANMPIDSTAVFARRGLWLIVQVTDKEKQAVTDLNSIRNRVLLDYRRQLADDALQSYADGLRERADIEVAMP